MIYKTKYDRVFISILVGLGFFLVLLNLLAYLDVAEAGLVLTMIFVPLFLLIFFAGLSLKIIISDQDLIVKIFRINFYKINIRKINKIKIGETMWVGSHKYGTSTKGIIIFSKYKDDCYITPKESDLFLKDLLAINPYITIEKV